MRNLNLLSSICRYISFLLWNSNAVLWKLEMCYFCINQVIYNKIYSKKYGEVPSFQDKKPSFQDKTRNRNPNHSLQKLDLCQCCTVSSKHLQIFQISKYLHSLFKFKTQDKNFLHSFVFYKKLRQ